MPVQRQPAQETFTHLQTIHFPGHLVQLLLQGFLQLSGFRFFLHVIHDVIAHTLHIELSAFARHFMHSIQHP